MHSLLARRVGTTVLIALLLSSVVSVAQAANHVREQPAALTSDPAPEVEQDLEPGTHYLLGTSGAGSHLASECAQPAGERSFHITWVSEPFFIAEGNFTRTPAITIIENVTIEFGFEPGEFEGAGSAPEAVAVAPVHLNMGVSWIRPEGSMHGPHPGWDAGTTAAPAGAPAEGLPGILPESVPLEIPFSADPAGFESGSRLVFDLGVTCDDFASFRLTFSGFGPLRYVLGGPNSVDTDGDGIPDEYDHFPDGTEWSVAQQNMYGTDPFDPQDVPSNASICEGYTIQEAVDEGFVRDDPATCPGGGEFPWLLLLIALLLVVLIVGGAYGAMTAVNRKIRMEVSHDGFQDIAKGASAVYTLSLTAKGAEGEEIPTELSLKGVPEDWSASVEPSNLLLKAGEDLEPLTATLTVTPPPEEEYEAEAVVTVTATPTDEDGKTSPMRPGTSVKTKTIVNIDSSPPDGKKRKKRDASTDEALASTETTDEAAEADTPADEEPAEGKKKGKGFGLLKRGKKKAAEEESTSDEAATEAAAAESAAAAAAGAPGKPDLAVGKMKHEPADFSEGDTVTTTVPVRNKGDAAVEGLMLRLYVNDERVDEKEVNLEPGATSEVTFSWTAQPDENRVRVRGGLKEA